jgi:hypothetical protein
VVFFFCIVNNEKSELQKDKLVVNFERRRTFSFIFFAGTREFFGFGGGTFFFLFAGTGEFFGFGRRAFFFLFAGAGELFVFGRGTFDFFFAGAGEFFVFGGRAFDFFFAGTGEFFVFGRRAFNFFFAGAGFCNRRGALGRLDGIVFIEDRLFRTGTYVLGRGAAGGFREFLFPTEVDPFIVFAAVETAVGENLLDIALVRRTAFF